MAVTKGIFIVRYLNVESRDTMLNEIQFFDCKPLIIKKWHPNMDMKKEELQIVPIWLQVPGLDLKY